MENPTLKSTLENPTQEKPTLENPMQLNKDIDIQKDRLAKKEKSNTDLSNNYSIPILSLTPLLEGRNGRAERKNGRQTHTACMRKSSRTISSMTF